MGHNVVAIQPHTQSFVVKVWLVAPGSEAGRSAWRGRITHVPSGHCQHFADIGEIAVFIAPYLHRLGVKPTRLWRVQQWLRR